MKANPYMNAAALQELLKVHSLGCELEKIAAKTKGDAKTAMEKKWAKHMKMSSTLLSQIVDERLTALDEKQRISVERRVNNSAVSIEARDTIRVGSVPQSTITISSDDLTTIAELALMGCGACPQGKYVKDCPYREMFHRIGVPIGRDEVQEGQCEFMTRDEPKVYMPRGLTDEEMRKKFSDEDRELLI